MGKLVVIEGLDGSGKSTQLDLLFEKLQNKGIDCKSVSFPDYANPSSTLVKMYLNGDFGKKPEDVNAFAASVLFAADRFASYTEKWKNDYLDGTLIFSDRYTPANALYQMTKLEPEEWDSYLEWLFDFEYNKIGIPEPTMVVFLDMPVEVSQKLMTSRYNGDESKKDVHECDVAFLHKCREAALYACAKYGWKVISCAENGELLSIETINDKIYNEIKSILK
jgi:dTMP kinase